MKTFDDLVFKPHPIGMGAKICQMSFPNGYGVSVVGGAEGLYGDGINTFELAVTKDGELCYDSGITDDVIGYLSQSEVTEVMQKVQLLGIFANPIQVAVGN